LYEIEKEKGEIKWRNEGSKLFLQVRLWAHGMLVLREKAKVIASDGLCELRGLQALSPFTSFAASSCWTSWLLVLVASHSQGLPRLRGLRLVATAAIHCFTAAGLQEGCLRLLMRRLRLVLRC